MGVANLPFSLQLRPVRSMDVSDEERSIILRWREIVNRGQLIVAKVNGKLDNCEIKMQHTRSSFMGVGTPVLDNGGTQV